LSGALRRAHHDATDGDRIVSQLIRLGVNIDHVATLRQARGGAYPDPLYAAFQAAEAGADGITMHLREDRRHVQDRDVWRVREHVACRLNLEMAATDEMVGIATAVRPDDCCLVPESRAEITTEGGLDVRASQERLRDVCAQLGGMDIRGSLFIDPEPAQVEAACRVGARAVEIHTGRYANAGGADRGREHAAVVEAIHQACDAGLLANAGHGLDYHNVQPVAAIAGVHELNIGHAIIARALSSGLPDAVREMKRLIREARA
jgi:pyridoxine 5-phosphate synthase